MKITKRQLRRIIRESFSDSQSISRGRSLGQMPVGIDPSRHTGMSTSIDALISAIDELAMEEDLELDEIKELRSAANKLNDCMTSGDPPEVCATKIMDSGLENAFAELGYVIHDALGGDALSDYALNVEQMLGA